MRSGTRSILALAMVLDRYHQLGQVRGVCFTNMKLMFDDVNKNKIWSKHSSSINTGTHYWRFQLHITSINNREYRSICLQMFFKVGAFKNFANFTEKQLSWSLFWVCNFVKKRLQHWCFSMKFAKFLRKSFFTEHLPVAAFGNRWSVSLILSAQ